MQYRVTVLLDERQAVCDINFMASSLKTITVKIAPALIAALDDIRRKKTPIPSRSDVIREFVERGLAKKKEPA